MKNDNMLEVLLNNARKALKEFESATQEEVDRYVKAMCLSFKEHAEELARLTIEETGLGDLEAKIEKNLGAPDGIWYDLNDKKSVGIIGEDPELKLKYVASPKGILASVAPTTNPNVTIIFNGTYAIKGRNVLIVAPHPRAIKTSLRTCEIMNDALKMEGAPDNLIQCIEEPSIELTQELMRNSNAIIATGGAGMVQSAYSSGHPAFGVGPGNVQTIFDRNYSDYKKAINQTVTGRKYDNGLICACNQSFIIPDEMENTLTDLMESENAYYVSDENTVNAFRNLMFPDGKHINPKVVEQDIQTIGRMIGLEIPENIKIAVLKINKKNIGEKDPLCGEKMCPVAISITYDTFEEAVDIAKANLDYQGSGHSSVVHTDDVEHAEYCVTELPVSRMLVNQPGIFAANPALANGFRPTSTLGCGSWGNNSISENLTFEHLINISRVGWMKDEEDIPTAEEIWKE